MNAALRPHPADSLLELRALRWGAMAAALLALGLLLAAAWFWLARSPLFAIRAVVIESPMQRNSVLTVRANAVPKLRGNFFSIDLGKAKAAFESVPWVRQAVVRRVWPNQLTVRLVEHEPAALWQGEDGNDKLLNSFGEVFEANVGDVADRALPAFVGPSARAAEMLQAYRKLQPLFAKLGLEIETLSLSGRGSWRAEFDSDAVVELGRGTPADLAQRAALFARTVSQVSGRFGQPMLYADLRHSGGYALRLKNVSTQLDGKAAPAGGN
jgi:cell division protein FtsQ